MKMMIARILATALLVFLANCSYFIHPEPYHNKGAMSAHFNGATFIPETKENLWNEARFLFTVKDSWSTHFEEIEPPVLNEFKIPNIARVTFIGQSTFLIQLPDINILTDPIWSNRAGPIPLPLFSVKRQNPPALVFEDLPQINYVLISYNSYYHMDIPTIKKLQETFRPTFVTGLGNCYYLKQVKKLEIKCIELDWDQKIQLQNGTDIHFVKTKNWSKRSWFDKNKTLWGSFAIMSPSFKIYFAGDTGYSQNLFRDIHAKFGKFDLSLLPIGSYEPRWRFKDTHLNPQEAVKAHVILGSTKSIGHHFNTFQTSNEGYYDAQIELEDAKKAYDLSGAEFVAPEFGEVFEF